MSDEQGRTPPTDGSNFQPDAPVPPSYGSVPPSYGPVPSPYGPAPQQPPQDWWAPPAVVAPSTQRRRRRRVVAGLVAGAVALTIGIGSIAVATDGSGGSSSDHTAASAPIGAGNPFAQGGLIPQGQAPQYGGPAPAGPGGTSNGAAGSTSTGTATAAQQVGVVDINTVLDFGTGAAAGTGMVLTSSGEILTNNHVIDGSTSISVTVVSTGRIYTATVVGTDPTDDVAVLQLNGASGLATAKIGDSAQVAVGNTVTAVGNAGGTGGTPSSATGTVTALDQSLTATDQNGSNPEQLTGMIEMNADIQPAIPAARCMRPMERSWGWTPQRRPRRPSRAPLSRSRSQRRAPSPSRSSQDRPAPSSTSATRDFSACRCKPAARPARLPPERRLRES